MTHPSQCYLLQSSCLFLRYLFLNIYLTSLRFYEGSQTINECTWTIYTLFLYTVYTSIEYITFILYVYMEMQLNKTFMRLHSPEWKIKQTYHVNGGYTSHTHTNTTKQGKGAQRLFLCVLYVFFWNAYLRHRLTGKNLECFNMKDHLYSIPSRFFSAVSLSLSTVVSLGL